MVDIGDAPSSGPSSGPSSAPTVVLCGLATLDLVQTVDHVPAEDEKVVARELHVAAGGPASNAAVTVAALGVRAVLVTRVGEGPLAGAVLADLTGCGVQVRDRAGAGFAPAVSVVLVTAGSGRRAVVSVNAAGSAASAGPAASAESVASAGSARAGVGPGVGARTGSGAEPAAEGSQIRPPEESPDGVLDGATVLLVDGHHLDLAVPLAQEARRRGVPVLLDGGSWKPGLDELLAAVDVAVLSEVFTVPEEVRAATSSPSSRAVGAEPGDPDLAALLALGPAVVARSRGPAPVVLWAPDTGADATGQTPSVAAGAVLARREVPVPRVTVRDTLGAGDVLHGALAAWWALHPEVTPRTGPAAWTDALSAAARVASSSCRAVGARGWLTDAALVAAAREGVRAGLSSSGR